MILLICLMPAFSKDVQAASVKINSTNFPDQAFRNYLLNCVDYDQNKSLDAEELAEEEMFLADYGIKNLKGISYFTGLRLLDVSGNQLTSLDVSANTSLVSLSCEGNSLTTLDLSKNTALTEIFCAHNPLSGLDLTKNTLLESLSCYADGLTELNLTKNTKLTFLDCEGNSITSLDLMKNTRLVSLYCAENLLTSLNLSKNTKLDSLTCDRNKLKSLDLSKNTLLTYLYCSDNKLTTLDLSKNTELEALYCGNNNLKSIDLTKNTKLDTAYLYNNALTSIDISKNTKLKSFGVGGNYLPGLDISKNTYLKKALNGTEITDGDYESENGEYSLSFDSGTSVYASLSEKPVILEEPEQQSVKAGETATFFMAAELATSIEWQYRTSSGGTWTTVSALEGKMGEYHLTTKAKHDSYQYRCKVTNRLGTVYTNIVTLMVASEKPVVTKQPADQFAALGGGVSFQVEATGGGLTYQWQYRTSSSESWQPVSAANGKTAKYGLTAKAKHDGYQYRCVVKNAYGKTYSNVSTLRVVTDKPTITTQPKNKTVTAGKTAKFTVTASGLGLTYQWYYRTSGTDEWKPVSASSGKTASYSLTAKAKHNGYQYRCLVSNPAGEVYTKTVTLTVN